MLTFSLVCLLVFGGTVYYFTKKNIQNDIERHLITVSNGLKQQIELLLQQNAERILLTSSRTQLRKSLQLQLNKPDTKHINKMRTILLDAQKSISDFIQIDIHDAHGNIITSTAHNTQNLAKLSQSFKQLKSNNDVSLDNYHIVDNKFVHVFTTPLTLNNQRLAYLSVHTQFSALYDSLNNSQLLETGNVYLIEKRHLPDNNDPIFKALNQTAFLHAQENNIGIVLHPEHLNHLSQLQTTINNQNETTFFILNTIKKTPWHVLITQTESVAFINLYNIERVFLWVAGFSIVLTLFLAYWLASVTSHPILAVIEQTHKIATGEAEQIHLSFKQTNELALLADSINTLSKNLNLSKQNLEQKVTEKTEKLEALTQEAIKQNQATNEFLANMSHEIRTPMTGVLGMTELLGESELNEKQHKWVCNIKISGQNLLTIINDILDFSKVQQGCLQLRPEPTHVRALFNNIASIFNTHCAQKGINLNIIIHPEVPDYLMIDSTRFCQILYNIVGNAIKFTDKGEISVNASLLHVSDNLATIAISVVDTGQGMSESFIENMFSPYAQEVTANNKNAIGTGLGLAISKQLVEIMGGNIWVESDLGLGTKFNYTLEIYIAAEPETKLVDNDKAAQVQLYKNAKILVVEDNEINREVAIAIFNLYNIDVDIAINGEDAVEQVKNKAFDIVFMDIQMPIMDGLTATKTIRMLDLPKGSPTIIALTANVLPDDIDSYLNSGMNDHISKPIQRDELEAKLTRWLT